MNTPNPLMPQGSLPSQASSGKSTFRVAVLLIVALHAVFLSGLLWQGCKRDTSKADNKSIESTNGLADLPKLSTNEYYSGFSELPSVASTNHPAAIDSFGQTSNQPPPLPLVSNQVSSQTTVASNHSAVSKPADQKTAGSEKPVDRETKEYIVARGDYFANIAKSHKVSLAALKKSNPNVDPNHIHAGQKLQIPAPDVSATETKTAAKTSKPALGFAEPPTPGASSNVHVVKAGENLTKIAKLHGTSLKAIREANNLKSDRVVVGQKLKLPATNSAAAGPSTSKPIAPLSATNSEPR
jgi:LysM repeat protein